jgi:hypothetical protein
MTPTLKTGVFPSTRSKFVAGAQSAQSKRYDMVERPGGVMTKSNEINKVLRSAIKKKEGRKKMHEHPRVSIGEKKTGSTSVMNNLDATFTPKSRPS